MSELRERMIRDLKLAGLNGGTQQVYLRAVRQLAAYYMLSPDQLSERQVQDYILYVRDELAISKGTFEPMFFGLCGSREFHTKSLKDITIVTVDRKRLVENVGRIDGLRVVSQSPALANLPDSNGSNWMDASHIPKVGECDDRGRADGSWCRVGGQSGTTSRAILAATARRCVGRIEKKTPLWACRIRLIRPSSFAEATWNRLSERF